MNSDVEKIKEKLSIEEVVGGYIQLQRAGANFRARCPFHKERTPSFMVSPERGTYMCFGCGERGDIFSFVQKIEGSDFPTVLRQLAERAGVTLQRGHSSAASQEHKEKNERLYNLIQEAVAYYQTELYKHADVIGYLHSRGVKDETIASWKLGYAPAAWRSLSEHLLAHGFTANEIADSGLAAKSEKAAQQGEARIYDRFRGRIMFPIADTAGRPIAFSGRYFENMPGSREDEEPAKYVNSPETELFKKSKVLYGLDRAKGFIRKADCILLVEGQFDLVMSHQSGLPFAVAVSGTALTQEHLQLLGRFSKRLILALDADAAGLRAGLKSAAMAYAAGFDVKIPTLVDAKDPADVARDDPEALKAAIRGSQTAVEFFLYALRAQAKDDRAYKQAVEAQVLPLIAAMHSRIDQEHFMHVVAQKIGVSEDAVRAEVSKRPVTSREEGQETAAPALGGEVYSQLERSVGMLIFSFDQDEAVVTRVAELLGESRFAAMRKKMEENAERFRFEFDIAGEDSKVTSGALFTAIERALVEEEMQSVNGAIRSADAATVSELLKKLSLLKKRQQELRA